MGFLKKVSQEFSYIGEYYVIYEDDFIKEAIEERENFKFYKINFYSYHLYEEFFYKDTNKIIIFIKNRQEALFVLDKVKDRKIPIVFIDFWNLDLSVNNYVDIVNVEELLINKVIDHLPQVPLYARDIGLGQGEILEVEVPPYSSFAYRRVKSVNSKDVKIVAIYRNNTLRLIDNSTLILPNDKLIVIGEPQRVKEFFMQIKKDIGVFPQPFGQNIYLLIDMKNMKQEEISKLLKTALFLHRNLNNKRLIVKVINPGISAQLYKLYKFNNITINTDFFENNYIRMLKLDVVKYNVGLIITNNSFFYKYKKEFFNLKLPILKSGKESIKKCKEIDIVLHENNVRTILPTIFDLVFQLKKRLNFIEGDPEENYDNLIEYINKFKNLFHFKNINFEKIDDNPVIELNKRRNICIITPFNKVPRSKFVSAILPSIDETNIFLDKFNQFLIPISVKDIE